MPERRAPERGYVLIARIALQHPDRLPRDVLAETFGRERTIAAAARFFGTQRAYVAAALGAFGLYEVAPAGSPARQERRALGGQAIGSNRRHMAEIGRLGGQCVGAPLSNERREGLAREIGIPALADNFPAVKADTFRAVIAAMRDGRLETLRQNDPRAHKAILLRFGLDALDRGVYRKLVEVADVLGVTKQRVLDLEKRALAKLGIATRQERRSVTDADCA